MKALSIAPLALLAATPQPPLVPAAPGALALCAPPPQRAVPRKPYERADKWRHDQRTIA